MTGAAGGGAAVLIRIDGWVEEITTHSRLLGRQKTESGKSVAVVRLGFKNQVGGMTIDSSLFALI